jgi:hypothetical protein
MLNIEDAAEAERIFNSLSQNGAVQMPCRKRSGRCALACSLTNSERHGRSIAENRGEALETHDFVRRVRPMNLAAVDCPSRQNAGSLAVPMLSVRVPIRVRRPSAAREALRFSPLVKASGADATCIERIPIEAACAKPFVLLPGRPAAERTADAGTRWFAALLFLKLAVWNDDRTVCDRTHAITWLATAEM